MKKVGGYMVFFGLFAIVLNFMGRVPSILMWIYNWGETVAWGIKIALIVVGIILYFAGNPGQSQESNTEE